MSRRVSGIDTALGETLRLYRRAAGMSQAELGAAAGVSFQQIQKYETGDNRVSVNRLFQLAQALRVDPVTLISDAALRAEHGQDTPLPQRRLAFVSTGLGGRAVDALAGIGDPAVLAALTELAEAASDRHAHTGRG